MMSATHVRDVAVHNLRPFTLASVSHIYIMDNWLCTSVPDGRGHEDFCGFPPPVHNLSPFRSKKGKRGGEYKAGGMLPVLDGGYGQ
jgi:hypothetical protein